MKHAGRVHHQTALAVEDDGPGVLGQIARQFGEFLVHGLAARHEFDQLRLIERGNLRPTRKVIRLHVQRRQEPGAFGKLPDPDVAVFHVPNQIRQRFARLEELPGQARTGLFHIEMKLTATADKTCQGRRCALVVVQQHQLGSAPVDGAHDVRPE